MIDWTSSPSKGELFRATKPLVFKLCSEVSSRRIKGF